MPLTIEQGEAAAAIVQRLKDADVALAGLTARIADCTAGTARIVRMAADLADGTSIRADVELTPEESATLLGGVKSLVEAKRQANLEALTALG
ncbi:MAG: hypothetical protein U1E60_06315 [Reyranellaceae bacterium]